jgi:hypothetical protein
MNKPLPERFRLARNLAEGMEIRVKITTVDGPASTVHFADTWLPIVGMLDITAPVALVSLTVRHPDGVRERLDATHPSQRVMSRGATVGTSSGGAPDPAV